MAHPHCRHSLYLSSCSPLCCDLSDIFSIKIFSTPSFSIRTSCLSVFCSSVLSLTYLTFIFPPDSAAPIRRQAKQIVTISLPDVTLNYRYGSALVFVLNTVLRENIWLFPKTVSRKALRDVRASILRKPSAM